VGYEQAELHSVTDASRDNGSPPSLGVSTTLAGRAFLNQEVMVSRADAGCHVWIPIVDRSDPLGVLDLELSSDEPGDLARFNALGQLAGMLVRTSSRYSDIFEIRRRGAAMNLAAEMQWSLLPPLNFSGRGLQISGQLEPAYEIGGDAFDYALNESKGFVAVFDAMGHGLEAAEAVSLALGTYRYCRRNELSLVETATTIDVAISHLHRAERFVTGQLYEIDTTSGRVRWINAGHPGPMLFRGHRAVEAPAIDIAVPFGLGTHVSQIGEFTMQPGDRLLLLSDGGPEARPDGGDEFGIDRIRQAAEAELGSGRSAAEMVRGLIRLVLAHRSTALEDDVTFVLIGFDPTEPDDARDLAPQSPPTLP
jgi:serine phosphatase RsbU (regulator of sigma subunit)